MIDINKEITLLLQSEVEEVKKVVLEEAKNIALDTSIDLKKTSPKRSGKGGKYAKGWGVKESKTGSWIVYNKKYYRLTHLLEKGHEIIVHGKALGRRTKAIEHIKPAEEKFSSLFIKRIKERLSK